MDFELLIGQAAAKLGADVDRLIAAIWSDGGVSLLYWSRDDIYEGLVDVLPNGKMEISEGPTKVEL